jgi:hypothetical protein
VTRGTPAALAYACAYLDDLDDLLGAPGRPLLDLLRVAAREGADPGPALDSLHAAVQAAGDARGVYGPGHRGGWETVGVVPADVVYRCPLASATRCTGRLRAAVRRFPPVCGLSPAPVELVRERLD